MEETIRSILERDGFALALLDCETAEQAQALFAGEGLELQLQEVRAIGRGLRNALFEAEELDEDCLDSVAGGLASLDTVATAVSVLSSLAGALPHARMGFLRWR